MNALTAALNQLLNSASPELVQCLTDDLNTHLSAIRRLGGGRTTLRPEDVHNLLLRWTITSQAITDDRTVGKSEDGPRENMLKRFVDEIGDESAIRGERQHDALSD